MTITPSETRVAVLLGGRSAEREVSLNSGAQVAGALEKVGFDVVTIDTAEDDFVATLQEAEVDVVFIALHGRFGEDGTVQGMLELLELPYTGSGVLASALAMDKVMSKLFFTHAGLATPDYVVLRDGEPYELDAVVEALGSKVVVKPACEGSSVGMTIVHNESELPDAVDLAFKYDKQVLVERFVAGVEVTVAVLGNHEAFALPTLEIQPVNEFYDYDSKYVPGMSRHIIPARVPERAAEECQRLAVAAHRALGCRGLTRSDTIVEPDGSVWLLEVNTIPGMTSTSLVPDAARAQGIDFPDLCKTVVELALEPRL